MPCYHSALQFSAATGNIIHDETTEQQDTVIISMHDNIRTA